MLHTLPVSADTSHGGGGRISGLSHTETCVWRESHFNGDQQHCSFCCAVYIHKALDINYYTEHRKSTDYKDLQKVNTPEGRKRMSMKSQCTLSGK